METHYRGKIVMGNTIREEKQENKKRGISVKQIQIVKRVKPVRQDRVIILHLVYL